MANAADRLCPGSLTFPNEPDEPFGQAETAVCEFCGATVTLGYGGRIPAHAPLDERSAEGG